MSAYNDSVMLLDPSFLPPTPTLSSLLKENPQPKKETPVKNLLYSLVDMWLHWFWSQHGVYDFEFPID